MSSQETVQKSVVVVDVAEYGVASKERERHAGVEAVQEFNKQIQGVIQEALKEVGASVTSVPYKYTGDGAIVAFDKAEQASRFAEKLHLAALNHNRHSSERQPPLHFRAGIWTDQIVVERLTTPEGLPAGFEIHGTTIANAVRLEGACRTGEVLISPESWGDLPPDQRRLYSAAQEEVVSKHGERFRVHRRKVVEPAQSRTDATKDQSGPVESKGSLTVDRAGLIGNLEALTPSDFDSLVNKIAGAARQVSDHLTVPQRAAQLVRWAESPGGRGLVEIQEIVKHF